MREQLVIGRAFRDRHLQTLAGQPPSRDPARHAQAQVEKLVKMPKPVDVADKLLDREIFTSQGAVADLGLDPATMHEWSSFLDTIVHSSPIEAVVRQQLFQKLRAQDWDPELRKVMFQRTMSLYRNTQSRKSVYTPDELAKSVLTGEDVAKPMVVVTVDQLQKAKHQDQLPGGLADKKKPSDFDPKALEAGIKVELEHTNDRSKAREIAMDHLTEDPAYYRKLKTIEKAGPFIGPKGGKWADAKHTIPWKEDNPKVTAGKFTAGEAKIINDIQRGSLAPWQYDEKDVESLVKRGIIEYKRFKRKSDTAKLTMHGATVVAEAVRAQKQARESKKEKEAQRQREVLTTPREEAGGQLSFLNKADPRGGSYHRRVPYTAKSGKQKFRYYYTEDDYNKRADAHHSGEDMAKVAMGRAIDKALDGAGDQGCAPADLKHLAKKYGGKQVAEHLKRGCGEGGSMSYKGGRFYRAKAKKESKGDE